MEEANKLINLKKLSKTIPIPTNDSEVKKMLREIGRPIILFGENVVERRERLKKEVQDIVISYGFIPDYLSKRTTTGGMTYTAAKEDETFYTEGSHDLKKRRMDIALYSLPRSSYRIEVTKKKYMEVNRIQESIDYEESLNRFKHFEFLSSQTGDERGCSRGTLTPDDELYGVAGWSGTCSIFNSTTLNKVTELKGHTEKVNCISFHPGYKTTIDPRGPNVLTSSNDNTIRLWSLDTTQENQKSRIFRGHEERVNMIEFHPMGTLFASTSHDQTWRLWDIETKKEILLQEGHNAEVYGLSFQKDGALIATADLHGIGLVWDLRSGRVVTPLVGHVKQILTIKFSPNCFQIATGGDDNAMKFWDLRKPSSSLTIPAHNSTISSIEFEHEGKFLLSCSYDSSIKLWNNRDWTLIKSYQSPTDGKLTSVSITKDGGRVLTASMDRTIKMWSLNK